MKGTGCPYLNARGLDARTSGIGHSGICLEDCPFESCQVKDVDMPQLTLNMPVKEKLLAVRKEPVDIAVQCPCCLTIETLQVDNGRLVPTRRFWQRNGLVYHDCGSTRPCRVVSIN